MFRHVIHVVERSCCDTIHMVCWSHYRSQENLGNLFLSILLQIFQTQGALAEKLMMLLFALIYLRNYGCHPVFHSSLLEPYRDSTILNRITPPPLPIESLEDGPEYEVAAILDSKIVRNKLYYLVDWLGYSPSERTWEPVTNLANAQALLDDFHHQYLDKLVPQSKKTHDTRRLKGRIVS